MKVKLVVNQTDIESGFSSIKDYKPVNLNKFATLKEEVLGQNNIRGTKPSAISVYADGLNLPNYTLKDIYCGVEQLIQSRYSYLEGHIEDFALIASYLNRYSENNNIWSEEFHGQLKKYDEEVLNAVRFINKLQKEGMDISSISVEYKQNRVPERLEFTNDALMKMWVGGFALEFKKPLQSYKLGVEDRGNNKIQNEYYAPMLKAYFEMLHNEGLFRSKNSALLLFGYLAEIAGAFIYDMSVYENKVRKKSEAQIKPIYEDELQELEKKVQQAITREKKKLMTSNVNSMRNTYLKQTGVDIFVVPKIIELPELCSLRGYTIHNNIKAERLLAVDYLSAAEFAEGKYHKDKLDALLL